MIFKTPREKNKVRRARRERRYARSPSSWRRRFVAWLDMLFVDHGVIRLVYLNLHRIGSAAWRSAQPSPGQLRRLARRRGVRTIVNCRGQSEFGSYSLERETCEAEGLAFEEIKLRSRMPPPKETIEAADILFRRIEYPALFHCKSGADRAGLMSALYVLLREGGDVDAARDQLHWRYGHFRAARTGVLDRFFDMYAEAQTEASGRGEALPFLDWVRRDYDPAAVKRTFHENRAMSVLVDRVLGRE